MRRRTLVSLQIRRDTCGYTWPQVSRLAHQHMPPEIDVTPLPPQALEGLLDGAL
jgi:hypothetical protein